MLSRVHFKNIRALADLELTLTPLTVLVGPNACGKSTVLDEIERLCAMSLPQRDQGFAMGGPGLALQRMGRPPLTSGQQQGTQEWIGHTRSSSLTARLRNKASENWFGQLSVTARANTSASLDRNTPKEAAAEFNELLRERFSWRAQRLSLERRMILAPSPVDSTLDRLDPSGYGLATLLLHLAANEPEAYRILQSDLTSVVPDFQRLHVQPIAVDGVTHYSLELTFGGAGRIKARDASEGTLLALGLLTAIHAPAMPEIILLDDLDRGLHLSAQYELISAIREVLDRQQQLQIICTSHSPILVDSFRPEEIRVMALGRDGHTQAQPLTALPDFEKWSTSLQPGELWANFGESWVTGHAE